MSAKENAKERIGVSFGLRPDRYPNTTTGIHLKTSVLLRVCLCALCAIAVAFNWRSLRFRPLHRFRFRWSERQHGIQTAAAQEVIDDSFRAGDNEPPALFLERAVGADEHGDAGRVH